MEETCPSSQTPIFKKKKKAKKLIFPGPTIQDSEEEDPNTPSNWMEVDSEVELIPQKGKVLSGTEFTQGSDISKRQLPDMPMISEPEFELSMSNSNREKSHSEGSNRHLYEPVQTVLHSVQEKRLGNVATNPPRSDELLAYPKTVPQRGNSEILQWMESTIIQASNQEDKGIPCQKER
ncbi:hypothetical protein O181_075064 [Austropuccinia psidii MF-1]|uniref:Uncharacterized protein n=1 Tax=Austropuccinia psidii MF-1 TaxID=1389203 RepID=A0A9Q3F9T6_9BASI|nr:hypothetical protein [Austropuccinia psidii MF-1]